jgi:hypothetical protein
MTAGQWYRDPETGRTFKLLEIRLHLHLPGGAAELALVEPLVEDEDRPGQAVSG